MSARESMDFLDRVICHLTCWRSDALYHGDVDGWQHYDLCVWLVRKLREAKSFEL
jgi:hypothetical protein